MSFMRLETKYTSNYCNITKITYILFIDVSMYQLISTWDWYQLSHVWFTCRHGQDQTVLSVSVLCTELHFETGQNNFETFSRRQSWLVASSVHTTDTEKTRQCCFVDVGGANWAGIGTRRQSSRPRGSRPETETRWRFWLHQPRQDRGETLTFRDETFVALKRWSRR